MYDVANETSFDAVRTWVNSIQENTEDSSPSVLLLVGNKIDLESERKITTQMGEEMAKVSSYKMHCAIVLAVTSLKTLCQHNFLEYILRQ